MRESINLKRNRAFTQCPLRGEQAPGQTCVVVICWSYHSYTHRHPHPYPPGPPPGSFTEWQGKCAKVTEGHRKTEAIREREKENMYVCVCVCDSMSVVLCLSKASLSLPEERSCWFNWSQAKPCRPCPHLLSLLSVELSPALSISLMHFINRTYYLIPNLCPSSFASLSGCHWELQSAQNQHG